MSLGEWTYIIGGVVVIAVYVGAVYVAWRALFQDRGRGKRRCPRCWHDLSRTPGMTCSECGFVARAEGDFLRTRRHWRVAGLTIVACVALAGWLYWTLADRGIVSYLPTRFVITVLPFGGDTTSPAYVELTKRIRRNDLTGKHWTRLLERCAEGDWKAELLSDPWKLKYGELIRARRWMVESQAKIDWAPGEVDTLLSVPPDVELSTRTVWPVGVPPRFRMQMEDWWPLGAECRVRITPQVDGADEILVYRGNDVRPWVGYSFEVPQVPGDTKQIEFVVDVERRPGESELAPAETPGDSGDGTTAEVLAPPPDWELMSTQTVAVKMAFTDDPDAVLTPVDSLELTEAMWHTFRWGAVKWREGPTPVRFYFRPRATHIVEFDDIAIGAHVDVYKGDQLARRLDIWWLAGQSPIDRGIGWEASGEDPGLLEAIDVDEEWSMRVTGDARLALRAGDATKYWSGSFVIPLRLNREDGSAPPRHWWTGESDEEEGS